MKHKSVWATLLCLAAFVILMVAAAPAGAIIGGQQDAKNTYSNVGVISVIYHDGEGGEWWDLGGSCTVVENDAGGTVVMTAAHCVDYVVAEGGVGIENMRVSFDPLLSHVGGTPVPGSYSITRYAIHATYLAALATTPYLGNAKMFGIGPGREDVALLWLDRGVPGGVEACAPIAGAGYVNELDLRSARFTVVGYGLNGFITGSFRAGRNPMLAVRWSGRNFKDVGVLTEHDAFGDRYLKVTECTAFGDSGGPTFHDGKVIAVTVWGGSSRCVGPAYQYRLDTASAQGFLRSHGIIQ